MRLAAVRPVLLPLTITSLPRPKFAGFIRLAGLRLMACLSVAMAVVAPWVRADDVISTAVNSETAKIVLSGLTVTYDGAVKAPTVTTSPAGLPTVVTYDGHTETPVNAGTYRVSVTIADPLYHGTASANFTIEKATPIVTWHEPHPITYGVALTSEQLDAVADVPGTFTYAPGIGTVLDAGPQRLLSVTFTPADAANYNAVATATTIAVSKALAFVALGNLTQPYDSTPATVSARTIPANLKVDLFYDAKREAPVFPGRYSVAATVDDPNYVGSAFDTFSLTVTALVRHAPRLQGGIDGSLEVLGGEDVKLSGRAWIAGDLLLPGTPSLDLHGLPMAAGTYDAGQTEEPRDYTVALGGTSVVRYVVREIEPLEMPVVAMPLPPSGTRDVTLGGEDLAAGDFTSIRDLTVDENVGEVIVPSGVYGALTVERGNTLVLGHPGGSGPDVYHLRSLTLRRGARLEIDGPVLIVLADGASIAGLAGNADRPEWLTIAVAAGGVTVGADSSLYGYIVAPVGEVVINRRALVTGEVISDRLTINPDGVLAEPRG